MKAPKFITLVACIFLLANCGKEDAPIVEIPKEQDESDPESEGKVYFTYNNLTYSDNIETWIIIHDSKGNLLDYTLIDAQNKSYNFTIEESNIPEKFSVTEMINESNIQDSTKFKHLLNTYTNVENGSVWEQLVSPQPFQPKKIGAFEMEITDIPLGSYGVSIQTTSGRVFDFIDESHQENGKTTINFYEVGLYEGETYILTVLDSNNNYRYLSLGHPDNGEIIQLSHDNFLPYNLYPNVMVPAYESIAYSSIGYTQKSLMDFHLSKGTFFTHTWDVTNAADITIGYLDGYDKYFTSFSIYLDNYGYGVEVFGEKLTSIDILPRPSFSIDDNSIYTFKLSTDLDFVRKSVFWKTGELGSFSSYTSWIIQSPGTKDHMIGMLPDEIVTRYPTLNMDEMEVSAVNLYTKSVAYSKLSGTNKAAYEFNEDYNEERILFKGF